MKVLHVITGLGDGGAEAMLLQLCRSDTLSQHLVVSLMGDGKYGALLRAAGVEVHCLNMPPGRLVPSALLRLHALVRRARPDVVQTWMYHADLVGGVVAKVAGVPAICWGLHTGNIDAEKFGRTTFRVAQLCARISAWVPDRVVSCSEEGARHHVELGYVRERMTVVANGYDMSRFTIDEGARARVRGELGISSGTLAVGMVARFDPVKDHKNLFQAIRQVESRRSFAWVLAGNGITAANGELTELIQALGQPLHLLGPRGDVPAIMNALDLHLLTSHIEGFPNVLAEAMACGTPCITTNVGDAARIVGETGWVVPPRDSMALAHAIGAAAQESENATTWASRRSAARTRIVENFSAERMAKGYRDVWGLALESRRARDANS